MSIESGDKFAVKSGILVFFIFLAVFIIVRLRFDWLLGWLGFDWLLGWLRLGLWLGFSIARLKNDFWHLHAIDAAFAEFFNSRDHVVHAFAEILNAFALVTNGVFGNFERFLLPELTNFFVAEFLFFFTGV